MIYTVTNLLATGRWSNRNNLELEHRALHKIQSTFPVLFCSYTKSCNLIESILVKFLAQNNNSSYLTYPVSPLANQKLCQPTA